MGFPPFSGESEPEWAPTTRQDGKVAIVTGSDSGLGFATAKGLVALGAHVVLAGNAGEAKFERAISEIVAVTGCPETQVEYEDVDLGSQASLRRFAERWGKRANPTLHLLVNNAGIPGQAGVTEDGWEKCWGVNYIGSTLLTRLLLDFMEPFRAGDARSAKTTALSVDHSLHGAEHGADEPEEAARIVFVSSSAHAITLGLKLDEEYLSKSGSGFFSLRYGESKLGIVLFAQELARRLQSVRDSPIRKARLEQGSKPVGALSGKINVYTVHPGTTFTGFWASFPRCIQSLLKRLCSDADTGARTILYCATEPDLEAQSGKYYASCAEATASWWAQDPQGSYELWSKTSLWTAFPESLI